MGRAPSDTMLHLQIGVKQGHFDELERHLNEGVFGHVQSTEHENVLEALKLTE